MNPKDEAEIVARFGRGETIGRIARTMHLSRKTVSRVVHAHFGAVTTGRTEPDYDPTPEAIRAACAAYQAGWSPEQTALKAGYPPLSSAGARMPRRVIAMRDIFPDDVGHVSLTEAARR